MIRIVLEGLRGETRITELCRREGVNSNLYYRWSKEFLEAGKQRLAGNTTREADSGEVYIHRGKGQKPRTVFLGKTSRKALRSYMKRRTDNNLALWVTVDGERLAYGGLRGIVIRRAKQAEVKTPSLHSFRRAFAINMLRAGVDVFSLQKQGVC